MKKLIKISILALVLAGVVGGSWFGFNKGKVYLTEQRPKQVASDFVNNVLEGYPASAYDVTTEGFKKQNNEETFTNDFKDLADKTATFQVKRIVVGKKGAVVTGTISKQAVNGKPAKSYGSAIRLEKVGDDWKVNSLAIL